MSLRLFCAITLSLLVLKSPAVLADERIVLTLSEAIDIALRDNRDIQLNQEKLSQAKSKIEEARGAFLPEINLNSPATYTRGLYKKDITNYSFSATVKQYLYKGGKSANTLKQAKYQKEIQDAVLKKAKLEIALNVKKAFYALLIAKEFSGINKIILENAKEHLDFLSTRYEKGEASESDLLKAQALLKAAESLYEESLNQIEASGVLLKNILCVEEKTDTDIKGDFEYAPEEIAIDEAILKALSMRPEIKQYALQEEADKAQIEITKAGNRPSIYGSLDYYSRSTTSLTFSPSKGWQDYNVIGLTLSWPIFDGWATQAKVEQAVSDLRQGQIFQDKVRLDIATQVKEAYLSLKTAIANLKPIKKDIEVYADNLKIIQAKYQDGISSDLDLKDARLALLISDFNQKQAIYDYMIAKAQLDNAIGAK